MSIHPIHQGVPCQSLPVLFALLDGTGVGLHEAGTGLPDQIKLTLQIRHQVLSQQITSIIKADMCGVSDDPRNKATSIFR
jgi:hypothetical protein